MIQLIHLHIPKSAGSSFNFILKRIYKGKTFEVKSFFNDVVEFDASKMSEDKTILHGHFDNRLLDQINKETIVISFLRDPLERIISGYYNILRDKKNPIYSTVSTMTLLEYVESGILNDADNGQIRRITGCYYDVPYGQISNVHLEKALEIISGRNYFVGISEFFDKSLLLLKKEIESGDLFYHHIHKGRNKPDVYNLNDDDLKRIIYLNRYDYILYTIFCKKLLIDFDNKLHQNELTRFKLMNRFYNISITPYLIYQKLGYMFKRSKPKKSN